MLNTLSSYLSNATLAAWLQAFAAIVALVISAWAVVSTGAEERRRDRLRARSIAVAIYPELLKLDVVIDQMTRHVERLKTMDRVVGQNVASAVYGAQLTIPTMIERNIDNVYLLGEPAGPAILQLVNMISQYNDIVVAISQRMVALDANQWRDAVDEVLPHLAFLSRVTKKATEDVQPLHDSVKG
ncbi:MAG: hypothetical protein P4L57_12570 [Rhizomicrobium sp.]|nr:hypothetical protein [Rhizomicrobium sp.]